MDAVSPRVAVATAIPCGLRRTVIEFVAMPRAYVLPISGAEGTADTLTAAVHGRRQKRNMEFRQHFPLREFPFA